MTTLDQFAQPKSISDAQSAFPASLKEYLPPYSEIPKEFDSWSNKWNKIISHWFFKGMKGAEFIPKEGIDANKALAHVSMCMRSYEPKHEHKMAGCAYLMSLWFEDVKLPERADR